MPLEDYVQNKSSAKQLRYKQLCVHLNIYVHRTTSCTSLLKNRYVMFQSTNYKIYIQVETNDDSLNKMHVQSIHVHHFINILRRKHHGTRRNRRRQHSPSILISISTLTAHHHPAIAADMFTYMYISGSMNSNIHETETFLYITVSS